METLAYFTTFSKPTDRQRKNNEENSYDSRRLDYYSRKSPLD